MYGLTEVTKTTIIMTTDKITTMLSDGKLFMVQNMIWGI